MPSFTLRTRDAFNATRSTDFWCPPGGGYIRFGADSTGTQVCDMLQDRGDTLTAKDADDLAKTIRQHNRKRREAGLTVARYSA